MQVMPIPEEARSWLDQLYPAQADQSDVGPRLGGVSGIVALYGNLYPRTLEAFKVAVELKLAEGRTGMCLHNVIS